MTNNLYPISSETVESAVFTLHRKAAHEQRAVMLLAAIRQSGLVGRVLNASCLPLAQKALVGYSVRYSINEYSPVRWRYLYVSLSADAASPRETWQFYLTTKDEPRLTDEIIDKAMDKARKDAQMYLQAAEQLTANVHTYNIACAYLRPVWDSINTAMLYADMRGW